MRTHSFSGVPTSHAITCAVPDSPNWRRTLVTSPSFTEMRRRNSLDVVSLVRKIPGLSRAEIATEVRLAKATVSLIVDDLLQKEVLQELGAKASAGGRRAIGLAFNPTFGYVLGICLDETEVIGCLLDLNGILLKEFKAHLGPGWQWQQAGEFLIDQLDNALAEQVRPRTAILGIGAGVPGPITLRSGGEATNILQHCERVIQLLQGCISCPVAVDSNTNMAALAETREVGVGYSDLVLVVRLGQRIRSAVWVGGSILNGSSGLAGELGHIKTPHNQFRCFCGARGCVNAVAGSGAMLERCAAAGVDLSNLEDLISCCQTGNQQARRIVNEAVEALGFAIATSVALLAPHVVIISGSSGAVQDYILEPLREAVSRLAPEDNYKNCRIVSGSSAQRSESFGAALLALKEYSFAKVV